VADPTDLLASLNIDPALLSTLAPSERAALQPIIDALAAGMTLDDDDADEDEDGDDPRVQELLRQMDAAGDVADELEGKLDALIAQLGREEVEMGQELAAEGEEKEKAGVEGGAGVTARDDEGSQGKVERR
jgi:hypothetical protein